MRIAMPSFVAAVLTVLLFFSSASGQEFAEQSESQKQLNKQGVDAMFASDFEKAILSFKSSLTLGELNVTYLNLGRAYAKNGDCAEAQASYDKVLTSPQVALPTPGEVKVFLDKYLADLDTTKCPGFVTFTCKPMSAKLSIDGGAEAACSSALVKLAPGEHVAVLALDSRTMEATFTVEAMAKQDLTMELPKKDEVVEKPLDTPKPAEAGVSGMALTGWILIGVGGVTLLTAEMIDIAVLKPKVDEWNDGVTATSKKGDIEALQSTNLAIFVGGGAIAATGLVLLLLDDSGGEDEGTAWLPDTVIVTDEAAALSWRLSF